MKHIEAGTAPLPGCDAGDPHKNTAKCGRRNDRDRRTAKRREKRKIKQIIRAYLA